MRWLAKLLDWLTIYVPVAVLGLLALGSYLLVKNTPVAPPATLEAPPRHVPDYFMRNFQLRSFEASGKVKSEVFGAELRHYPDTDTTEIDKPRILSRNVDGRQTVATAERAISNGDGSEVQLIGSAKVVREAGYSKAGVKQERLEVQGEFLQAFGNTERIVSTQPVRITRGDDSFSADAMTLDSLDGVVELRGRAKGQFAPRPR